MAIETRRSVRSSSDNQISEYRDAVQQIQQISDNRGYNFLAGLHGAPGGYCWHHQRLANVFHGVRLFLPWHRAYLYRFEQACQDQVDSVTIPWWDWQSDSSRLDGIPQAFSQRLIGGQPNPLYDAHVWVPSANLDHRTVRYPFPPDQLPGETTVEDLVTEFDQWADFNDELEGVHDSIHGWVGGYYRDAQGWPLDSNDNRIPDPLDNRDQWLWGDMGTTTASAFDPIFWSHHCMIDRIWALWQQEHGNSGIPNNHLDLVLEPFNMRVRDVLDIHELGYEYAVSESSVPGPM